MNRPDPRFVRERLRSWYLAARRSLPWRETRDPYRIWISEIMLQQTRAAAVAPYYERFLAAFPDIEALARAPEAELMARWNGLGYYARARNLRRAAERIVATGAFPAGYEEILALPGVGEYTAAAVASIAFGLPHAVLDGNVVRVMARLWNERGDVASAAVKRHLRERAQMLLDESDPATFNQAVMELGATVCVPTEPRCRECPLESQCLGRQAGVERQLPIKLRRGAPERVERTLLVIERKGKLLMWQRPPGKRMAGFWELPSSDDIAQTLTVEPIAAFRHAVMNRSYRYTVARAAVRSAPPGFAWVAPQNTLLSTTARKAIALWTKAHAC